MEDQEIRELADIINWCDVKDKEQAVKVCGNCKHMVNKVMCLEYDDSDQITIVSEQSSCTKWESCTV